MASKKDPYEYKTIITGMYRNSGGGKMRKMLRDGWEQVTIERFGIARNRITFRRPNPKFSGEVTR